MYERTVAEPRLTAGFTSRRPPGVGASSVADLRVVPGERVDDLVPGGDRGTRRDDAGTPPELTVVCDLLSDRYGVDFDSIWVNLYRDGADSVAWPNKEVTLTLIVTTPEFLKKHPEVVSKVLGVNRDWTRKLSCGDRYPARWSSSSHYWPRSAG